MPIASLLLTSFAEEIVLEAECAHELHGLDQVGAVREGYCFASACRTFASSRAGPRSRRDRCRRAFAIASRAALPFSPVSDISAIVSYQMPTERLAEIGIVLQRLGVDHHQSSISPGILLELNTSVASGSAFTSMSCGFQVTTAVESAP